MQTVSFLPWPWLKGAKFHSSETEIFEGVFPGGFPRLQLYRCHHKLSAAKLCEWMTRPSDPEELFLQLRPQSATPGLRPLILKDLKHMQIALTHLSRR